MIVTTALAKYMVRVAIRLADGVDLRLTNSCPDCPEIIAGWNAGDHVVVPVDHRGRPVDVDMTSEHPHQSVVVIIGCDGTLRVPPAVLGMDGQLANRAVIVA